MMMTLQVLKLSIKQTWWHQLAAEQRNEQISRCNDIESVSGVYVDRYELQVTFCAQLLRACYSIVACIGR